jgi:hypothetical protein
VWSRYWRWALACAGLALALAVFSSAWGPVGVLLLLALLGYPILLARAVAPEAFARALAELTGSQQTPPPAVQGVTGGGGVASSASAALGTVREQQWFEWARHLRANTS